MIQGKKLLIVVDTDWFFLSHRLPIAVAAAQQGMEVSVLATDTGYGKEIARHNINFIPFDFRRKGLNPLTEFKIIYRLSKVYRQVRPDIVHHVSMKIMMNGMLACSLAGVKRIVNAVTGMGSYFIDSGRNSYLKLLFSPFLRAGKRIGSSIFIFQNDDDKNGFINNAWAKPQQCVIIQGSGVDVTAVKYTPEPATAPIKIFIATRLIKDKGINEFISAAKTLKYIYKEDVEFILAGKFIEENPSRIKKEDVDQWVAEGIITYAGYISDMYPYLTATHIHVLPSYGEGLPKSLIESCAVGRPIVTTNVPGCRDVVDDGVNGFLVPAKAVTELTEAIEKLIRDKELRHKMGIASRKKAEKQFGIELVVNKTLELYNNFYD